MKKQKEQIITMTCEVCTDCYRIGPDIPGRPIRCHHGGPYTGYKIYKDYPQKLVDKLVSS